MTYDIKRLKLDGIDSQERKMGFGSKWTIHQSSAGFPPKQHPIDFRWVWTHNIITVILDVYHATTIHLNLGGH